MKLDAQAFRRWPNKAITLLGMSGVGKTTLASLLPRDQWFHYSGDYRIGTHYLNDAILDEVKRIAMQHPFLRAQLRSDSIYIRNNITIENLGPISDYLGKVGNPEHGGLDADEFKRRQELFRDAEIKAMADVGEFILRARRIYDYPHFLNDAGGSVCGLGDEECWNRLSEQTLVLYLETDQDMEEMLMERARKYPKPMNYEAGFFDSHLDAYLEAGGLESASAVEPDEFVQWMFPRLLEWRKPQYERIAVQHGYTANASDIPSLRDEQDFVEFVCNAIEAG